MWKNHRLHYAWVIVAVTFMATIMIAGVRATPTVLIVPFKEEFHWSLATISFAISLNLLLYGAVGPFAAAVMDRFGARRTMTLALAATAAAVALTPAMSRAWQLVALWGVVVGLSTGFVGAYLSAFIAARWFAAREGLVVGILTAGFAAGQLVFLPTMAALATNAGWRLASLVLVAAVVVLLPVIAVLMRDRPEDLGLTRYGETSRSRPAAAPAGNPAAVAFRALGAGMRSRDFWLIGGTISGLLSDRCDNRILLCCYYGFRGLALLFLPFALDMSFYGLTLFSMVYGLDWIAAAPPTVRLLSGVVGSERIGIMVAWITVIHQIGSASVAYFAGVLRIAFGTYFEAFIISGMLLVAVAVMVLFIDAGRGREPEVEPVVVV